MSRSEGGGSNLPATAEEWRTFFSRYSDIVLVANSDAVKIGSLKEGFGPGALFVFFNKTYKVLQGPFERPALLVARSSPAGANIVYRREVEAVVEPFDRRSFVGILNLRVSAKERFSAVGEFGERAVGFLDLSKLCADFYPDAQVPTSGFALALWLAEQQVGRSVHLAGFTGRRSARWKLFRDHDWTFEQTALRLLHRSGRLTLVGHERAESSLRRFARRFPELSPADVEDEALDVLADRLSGTENAIDGLISITRPQARLRAFMQALKPATRKAKLQRKSPAEQNALAKSSGSD